MIGLKVFDLTMSSETGTLDDSLLESFLEGKDIVSCTDHLVVHREELHLVLVVTYRLPSDTRRSHGSSRKDWRTTLEPDDAATYDRLRTWRNERAKRDGVPPYLVFNNRQLASMAGTMPCSLSALREIDGVGAASCEKYGAEVLEVLSGPAEVDGSNEPDGTPSATSEDQK